MSITYCRNLPKEGNLNLEHNRCFVSSDGVILLERACSTIRAPGATVYGGDTPMHVAAREDNGETIRDLLRSRDHDINARNAMGQTALHHATAATANHVSIQDVPYDPKDVQWDILSVDYDAKRIDVEASFYGYSFAVEALLADDRLEVNAADNEGLTALHVAAHDNGALRHIFPSDHIPYIKSMYGWDVVITINQRDTILPQLLQHPRIDINLRNRHGKTPLHLACASGNVLAIERLLRDPHCDVTIRDVDGRTAMHEVVKHHPKNYQFDTGVAMHSEIEPLEQMARCDRVCAENLDTLDNQSESAVSFYIRNQGVIRHYKDTPTIPDYFLDVLTPESLNAAKHTLPLAVEISSIDVCRQLLSKGADPDSKTVHGEPALFCAIRLNSLPKCTLLLEHGANLTALWNAMDALQYAIAQACRPEILELLSKDMMITEIEQTLKKNGIANETPLTASVRLKVFPWVKHFATPDNILQQDATGRTALEVSCRDPDIHHFLISLLTKEIPHNLSSKLAEMKAWYTFVKECGTTFEAANSEMNDKLIYPQCIKNVSPSNFASDADKETKLVTKCVGDLLMEIAGIIQADPNMSPLAFNPYIAGSIMDGTKTFMPDEFDTICVLKQVKSLRLNNVNAVGCTVKAEKDSYFHPMSVVDKVQPAKLASGFYRNIVKALRIILTRKTSIGNLYIPQNCLCLKDKISCLKLLWRGPVFKDMTVHVDLAPVIQVPPEDKKKIVKELPKPVPLIGDYEKIELIAKQPRHSNDYNFYFHVSYTLTENAFMLALPENIKSGFRMAKAMRIRAVCGNEIASLPWFQPREIINHEDYITSFMLKMTLLRLMYHRETKGANAVNPCNVHESLIGQIPDVDLSVMSAYEVADTLYADVQKRVVENKSMTSFYGEVMFQCSCQDPPICAIKVCCRKGHVILAMCRAIRHWIQNKNLVYSR